jgi:hypothetical protein
LTATDAVPAAVRRLAGTVTLRLVALDTVVGLRVCAVPPDGVHTTVSPFTKFAPVMLRVKPVPPDEGAMATLEGDSPPLLMLGGGVVLKLMLLEVRLGVAVSPTATAAVTALATYPQGTRAVRLVPLKYWVDRL